jgi:hypothetical protein
MAQRAPGTAAHHEYRSTRKQLAQSGGLMDALTYSGGIDVARQQFLDANSLRSPQIQSSPALYVAENLSCIWQVSGLRWFMCSRPTAADNK